MTTPTILCTFWVWLKEEDGPECTIAWERHVIDDNRDGWERAKQQIRDAYGSSIHSEREIDLRLSYDAILKNWFPDPIDVKVLP